jgi:hypothetical protein
VCIRVIRFTSRPASGPRLIGRASANGRSMSRAFRRLPAWAGCLVKVPSSGRTTFSCYPLLLDRDFEARVDPDVTGTGTGPTTSESTRLCLRPTPPVPPGPLRTSVVVSTVFTHGFLDHHHNHGSPLLMLQYHHFWITRAAPACLLDGYQILNERVDSDIHAAQIIPGGTSSGGGTGVYLSVGRVGKR